MSNKFARASFARVPAGFGKGGRTAVISGAARWASSIATSRSRPLPDFLIVGAQKAGTSSLCSMLFQHPDVQSPVRKEIHYFDAPEFELGERWYRAHFQKGITGQLCGEASPYYLPYPHAAARIKSLLPEVKLIIMLRNPVDRALSHYNHQRRMGRETLTFEEAIKSEPDRLAGEYEKMLADESYYSYPYWAYSYIARGMYQQQIDRYLEFFGEQQIAFVLSEDFFAEPANELARIQHFLGLDEWLPGNFEKQNSGGKYQAMSPAFRDELCALFEEPNHKLEARLGLKLEWR